jgi:hypothetical protein
MAERDEPAENPSDTRKPKLQHSYGTINKDYAISLATRPPEEDGPIYMVNLMKYKEVADYETGDNTNAVSGRDADDQYNPASILNKIGAAIVFVGDVNSMKIGTDDWDRIAVVRYPTRRSFVEMQSRKDFSEKHVHKAAGMLRTTIIACRPVDESLDAVERPTPRPAHSVAMIVRRTENRDECVQRQPSANSLLAEGVIIGDGRDWDVVQFLPVADDNEIERLAREYYAVDSDGTYVLGLRATLNSFIS